VLHTSATGLFHWADMTPQQLQTRLDAYLAAEQAILVGAQDYTIEPGDGSRRRVVKADLQVIREEINNLRLLIDRADASSSGARRVMYVR